MEKEFSPMEAFTCKVIFLKDEMGNNIKFEYMDLIQHATGHMPSSGRSIHRGPGKWKTPSSF